jgi:hypothetical protein
MVWSRTNPWIAYCDSSLTSQTARLFSVTMQNCRHAILTALCELLLTEVQYLQTGIHQYNPWKTQYPPIWQYNKLIRTKLLWKHNLWCFTRPFPYILYIRHKISPFLNQSPECLLLSVRVQNIKVGGLCMTKFGQGIGNWTELLNKLS